jgi:hypothetical protein
LLYQNIRKVTKEHNELNVCIKSLLVCKKKLGFTEFIYHLH